MSAPRITLKATNDGSHTLHTSRFDADYHSIHGARQEALHVYIEHGLFETQASPIRVLEVGFGTGLNMFLSILNTKKPMHYQALEPFPIEYSLIKKLNYPENDQEKELFETLHNADWNRSLHINNDVTIEKIKTTLESFTPKHRYDVVYFDAFGPNAQAELWTTDTFRHVYDMMEEPEILTTFCAQCQMKRNLKEARFCVTPLPGPLGKREMTLARKV